MGNKTVVKKGKQPFLSEAKAYSARKPNVKVNGNTVVTKGFIPFLDALANSESSYDPNVINDAGYKGYFLTKSAELGNAQQQFDDYYIHTGQKLDRFVREDIDALERAGFAPGQSLAAIHNQGTNILDYVYNKREHTDGNGTKVSTYGKGYPNPVKSLKSLVTTTALRGNKYIVQKGDNLDTIGKRVRLKGIHPGEVSGEIAIRNARQHGFRVKPKDKLTTRKDSIDHFAKTMQIGQPIYLTGNIYK